MTSYRYLEDSDVHVLDCSGRVDLQTGLARLKAFDLELKRRPIKGSRRLLLVDFRNTVWESEDVHLQLARTTRCDFGLNADNPALRAAILNNGWQGPVSDNEHWFLAESEAFQWLQGG
jgi:hypothetical protein